MSRKPSAFFSLLLLACIGFASLTACLPTAETCTWDTIDRPVIVSPGWDEVVDSLNPTLKWSYADPACPASRYEVILSPNEMDIATGIGTTRSVTDLSITWPDTLEPATAYYWIVVPFVETTAGEVSGPPSDAVYPFNTGPRCAGMENLLPPVLLLPADGSTVTRTDGFGFYWDDPTACLPGPYTLELSLSPDFADMNTFSGELRTSLGVYSDASFAFKDCTRYYWRVHARLTDGSYGPYAEAKSFMIDTGAIACLESPTPIPVSTPAAAAPQAEADLSSVCRAGPGMDYPILDYLLEGNTYPILGRNETGTWWLVQLNPNRQCWVFGELVTFNGDPSRVPVVQVEPPLVNPSVTPTDCSLYKQNPSACSAQPACQWVIPPNSNGTCVNR